VRTVNRHVSLLFRMGERHLNSHLDGTGVTSGTAPLLLELRAGGERPLSALAVAVGVDKAHITRSIRVLEKAGHVSVEPSAAGGRRLTASLTRQGRQVADRVERAMLAWVEIVSQGVDPADLEVTNAVFDQFYANALEHFAALTGPPRHEPTEAAERPPGRQRSRG
jgi:DNA-binding MarR family transcriptional regulator